MEELLNKLIKRGWKPFKIREDNMWLYYLSDNKIVISYYEFDTEWECNHEDKWCDLRQLTSKESWLWQFVCENHLYIYKMWENKNFIQDHFKNEYNECCYQYLYDKSCYEYYLLESALCAEDKLEKFLLDNIKVDG